jgi:hypothetical protein
MVPVCCRSQQWVRIHGLLLLGLLPLMYLLLLVAVAVAPMRPAVVAVVA